MTEQPEAEKASSDELAQVLARLNTDQIRFVVARQQHDTDKDAARSIGIRPGTVYGWQHKSIPIAEAVRLMALDGVLVAREMRRRNLAKAMLVKVAGLDIDDDRVRQAVATEIIEWEMGKAAQRQVLTGAEGGPLTLHVVWDDIGTESTPAETAPETGGLPGKQSQAEGDLCGQTGR